MLSFNVNGTIYNNTDTCKLYNLSAQMLHALDVYVMTDNIDAQNWLLETNADGSPKIELEIDKFDNGDVLLPGAKFPIKAGSGGESFSNPAVYKRGSRIDNITYKYEWLDITYYDADELTPHYFFNTGEMYNGWNGNSWQSVGSSNQFFRINANIQEEITSDRYIKMRITTNCPNPQFALLVNSSGGNVWIGDFVSGQEILIPAYVGFLYGFTVSSASYGYYWGITKIEIQKKSIDTIYLFDDNSHIQRLPSHNAIPQEPVRMIGGSVDSLVGTEWGKVRDVAPLYPPAPPIVAPPELSPEEQARWIIENSFDEAAFYNERSEWYINMATRTDFLTLNINASPATNLAELDLYMKDVIIILQPSQHQRLKKNYMYYDIDNEPPRIEITGVTY